VFEDLGKCGSAHWNPRFPGWIPSQRQRKEGGVREWGIWWEVAERDE